MFRLNWRILRCEYHSHEAIILLPWWNLHVSVLCEEIHVLDFAHHYVCILNMYGGIFFFMNSGLLFAASFYKE